MKEPIASDLINSLVSEQLNNPVAKEDLLIRKENQEDKEFPIPEEKTSKAELESAAELNKHLRATGAEDRESYILRMYPQMTRADIQKIDEAYWDGVFVGEISHKEDTRYTVAHLNTILDDITEASLAGTETDAIRKRIASFYRIEDTGLQDELIRRAVAPEGWESTVKKMKKHPEIDNPWALSWYEKNKGDKPGGKDK